MTLPAVTAVGVAVFLSILASVTANDQFVCTEDDRTFNICLSLNGFDESTYPSFLAARDRWSSVIDGNLASTSLSGIPSRFLCTPHPSRVDDVYVCAKGASIDGEGGIIGHSLVPYHRRTRNLATHQYHDLPLVGYMELDIVDAARLVGRDLEALLEHEMGHFLGIHGYFFTINGVLDIKTGMYRGGNANREWRAFNCAGFPPLDKGSDWHEGAFGAEIMSNYFITGGQSPSPLSSITVGGKY